MVAPRHFQLIMFTFACGGSLVKPGVAQPELSGTGGPNGGFVDASGQTADHAYDVSVSEAMLLPDTVQLADFDIHAALAGLLRRYEQRKMSK
jgi:hypothetical protein